MTSDGYDDGRPDDRLHRLDEERNQCDLCPRFCELHEGQQGFCFVRARQEDHIVVTTYARSSGFCVGAIEKKPLNHFLPGTSGLSFGMDGDNPSCKCGQSWEMRKSREMDRLADQASPETTARTVERLDCRSVAFTSDHPVMFHEYAMDVAQACRAGRLIRCNDNRPCVRKAARGVLPEHGCGQRESQGLHRTVRSGDVRRQLAACAGTLLYLKHHTTVRFEIAVLLIPGENDSEREREALAQWIVERLGPEVAIHFTAFHPDRKMLDRAPIRCPH